MKNIMMKMKKKIREKVLEKLVAGLGSVIGKTTVIAEGIFTAAKLGAESKNGIGIIVRRKESMKATSQKRALV